MLVEARQATYTEANILAGWRGAGLIPFNARHILAKLPHRHVSESSSPPPTTTIATPKNSSDLLRHTRQAKLMLKGDALVDKKALLDVIERLERFGIASDKDRDLERVTFTKWQETAKLAAAKDQRHIGKGYGEVINGRTLARLYKEQEAGDLKRAEKKQAKQVKAALQKPLPITPTHPSWVKRVTIQSPIEIESPSEELEAWDTDASSSSLSASTLSVITGSTPLPRPQLGFTPHTPSSPSIGRSRRSFLHSPSILSTPHARVTRFRSKCI